MPKPCYFGDKCRNKATCKFEHTVPVCTFFLKGKCTRGDSCPFRHTTQQTTSPVFNTSAETFVPADVETSVPTWEEMDSDMAELDILMEIEDSDPFARLDDDVEEDDDPHGDTVYYRQGL